MQNAGGCPLLSFSRQGRRAQPPQGSQGAVEPWLQRKIPKYLQAFKYKWHILYFLIAQLPLAIQVLQGISAHRFYELLQSTSEEQGLAPLQDDIMDQLVPRPVIKDFLRSLAEGMIRVLASICPPEE